MTKLQQRRSFLHRLRPFLRRHRAISMIVGQVAVLSILAIFALNSIFGIHIFSAFAETSCPAPGDTVYTIQSGDTLGQIAATNGTSWQTLAQYNQIADPNLIYANQQICLPGNQANSGSQPPSGNGGVPLHNTVNPFPYGQCTWWAAQRYEEFSGYFVPWTTNSDAWQWTARAYDFGWHVSDQPSVGAIIDFQPGVQYASSVGHVGIVEQILSNGDVLVSNMNVLNQPFGTVVDLTFSPGPGVTFITA